MYKRKWRVGGGRSNLSYSVVILMEERLGELKQRKETEMVYVDISGTEMNESTHNNFNGVFFRLTTASFTR